MKVAFFTTLDSAPWGGSEVLWIKTAKYFKEKGIEVACFVRKWPESPEYINALKEKGIEIIYYAGIETSFFKKALTRIKRKLSLKANPFSELIKWNPDYTIISQGHTYDIGMYDEIAIHTFLKSNLKYSLICQNNSDYNWIPNQSITEKIRKFFTKADQVYFVSRRSMEMAELLLLAHFPNFRTFSNSLSIPGNEIELLPFPDNKILNMASVANLKCSHKGQNLLLHVLSQEKWKKRSWILNLYGKGQDEFYLQNLVKFLGLNEKVHFCGYTKNIKKIWEHNHVLILASFGEGLPLALQEAMLFGRPALVTDVGGNSELVNHETGFLANGTTFSALDKSLEDLWADKDRLEQLGKNAFNFINRIIDLSPEKTLLENIKQSIRN